MRKLRISWVLRCTRGREATDLSFDITRLLADGNLYNKHEGELALKRKTTTSTLRRTHLSSTLGLQLLRCNGGLQTPWFWPATRYVSCSIWRLTSLKPTKCLSRWRNWPHSPPSPVGVWTSWRTNGRRASRSLRGAGGIASDDADRAGIDFLLMSDDADREYTRFACRLATTYEWNRIRTKDIISGHEARIPQPTGACPAPRLQRPRIVRDGVNIEQAYPGADLRRCGRSGRSGILYVDLSALFCQASLPDWDWVCGS